MFDWLFRLHITPLVIHGLGGGHTHINTHTHTHTDFPQFQKTSRSLAFGWHMPGFFAQLSYDTDWLFRLRFSWFVLNNLRPYEHADTLQTKIVSRPGLKLITEYQTHAGRLACAWFLEIILSEKLVATYICISMLFCHSYQPAIHY